MGGKACNEIIFMLRYVCKPDRLATNLDGWYDVIYLLEALNHFLYYHYYVTIYIYIYINYFILGQLITNQRANKEYRYLGRDNEYKIFSTKGIIRLV